MSESISRREFAAVVGTVAAVGATGAAEPPKPTEAAFTRDYDAPKFNPGWKKPQINRLWWHVVLLVRECGLRCGLSNMHLAMVRCKHVCL